MPFDVVLHTERAIDAEEHTLVEAPEDERPVRAVPEAAERHRREDVPIVCAPSAAAPAEREVEIVAQPGREADVPAAPVIARAHREERCAEVDDEVEAEPLGDAARDRRVAREVAVDLQGERIEADQRLGAGRHRVAGGVELEKDHVRDRREVVGEHHLLEDADQHEEQSFGGVARAAVARLDHLGQERRRAHDGSRDQMREEADEEREVPQVLRGRRFPAVDIDRVAHRLERVEADAGRQNDAEQAHVDVLDADRVQQADQAAEEEVAVLEEAEDRQIGDHADREERLPPRPFGQRIQPRQDGGIAERHRRRTERHDEVADMARQRRDHGSCVELRDALPQRCVVDVAAEDEGAAHRALGSSTPATPRPPMKSITVEMRIRKRNR